MNRNLQIVYEHTLIAESRHTPDRLLSKIHIRTVHIIEQSEIHTESYPAEHEFGLQAGMSAKLAAHIHKILLELEIGHIAAQQRTVAKLGVGHRDGGYCGYKGQSGHA